MSKNKEAESSSVPIQGPSSVSIPIPVLQILRRLKSEVDQRTAELSRLKSRLDETVMVMSSCLGLSVGARGYDWEVDLERGVIEKKPKPGSGALPPGEG